MSYSDKLIKDAGLIAESGGNDIRDRVSWRSPSNIALIKYWGKKEGQIPANPSLSFSLSKSYTETSVEYKPAAGSDKIMMEFYFEGKKNEAFGAKIEKYLNNIIRYMPFLKGLSLVIESRNSFPHSAGIASSASSMSSLALILCTVEKKLFGTLEDDYDFFRKASFLARLGSGSASRSVYGHYALWGDSSAIQDSSDEYAIPFNGDVSYVFAELKDTILIASASEKKVSSTAGHALMKGLPFAERRFLQANDNLYELIATLKSGDFEKFAYILENEALTLHSMMMMSKPSFILMNPSTLSIIERIRMFRAETRVPVTFTLDAGPNVHVIYPASYSEGIIDFIGNELTQFCDNGRLIYDCIGKGPVELV